MKKDKKTFNNYYEVIEVTNNWLRSLKRFKKLNSWLVCNGILYSVLGMITAFHHLKKRLEVYC